MKQRKEGRRKRGSEEEKGWREEVERKNGVEKGRREGE